MIRVFAFLMVAVIAIFFFLSSADRPRFVQSIEASGIATSTTGGGVSWGDYNGDGYDDLLVRTLGNRYRLYRNDGGTFRDITDVSGLSDAASNANAAVFGDYNNDGCSDIFMSLGFTFEASGERDQLFKNNCDGTFTDVSREAGIFISHHGKGAAWADYNNDGYLDVYVATYGNIEFEKTEKEWRISGFTFEPNVLYRNNGNGTFTDMAEAADVAGVPDCEEYLQDRNLPKAELRSEPTPWKFDGQKANWQPVWFDYNNDSFPDLFVSNEITISVLYRNNGDGTFTDTTEEAGFCQKQSSHGVAVGDYDGNGFLDLYVTGSRRNFLWMNKGDGTFLEESEERGAANFGYLGWGVGALDIENDGDLDVYVVNGTSENASVKYTYKSRADIVFLNDGTGHFTRASIAGVEGDDPKMFAAFADIDRNGFTDAFIIAEHMVDMPQGISRLYRNLGTKNHFLTIRLVGERSNRDGVGARITLEDRGEKQIREVISGASMLSQNSLLQMFGVGSDLSIDKITIEWPSGIVQEIQDIAADHVLTVREGT